LVKLFGKNETGGKTRSKKVKGVTPIIAIIVLLLITVALAGTAMTYLQGYLFQQVVLIDGMQDTAYVPFLGSEEMDVVGGGQRYFLFGGDIAQTQVDQGILP